MSSRRKRKRGTSIAQRIGMPVVLTTTTDEEIFADDATRFLATSVDDSPTQTRAIVTAQAKAPMVIDAKDLSIWQTAMFLLKYLAGDFASPPEWLQYIAEHLPLDDVRVRRDWERFLAFCKAVALCRSFQCGHPVNIEFRDYCVAYRIFEPVFASTLRGLPEQELALTRAVAKLNARYQRCVTVGELARELGWEKAVVYKFVKRSLRRKLLEYEPGTRERNVKRIRAREGLAGRFLPSPKNVLERNPKIGKEVKYVDPFSGTWKQVKR